MTPEERDAWLNAASKQATAEIMQYYAPTEDEVGAAAKAMFEATQYAHPGPLTESDCRVLARLALQAVALKRD